MCGLSLVRRVLAVSLTVFSVGCGGSSSPTPTPASPSPSAPTVASVAVTGPAALTAVGQTSQLTATATMSDSTTQNVTNAAAWQSSNQAVMTVSGVGLVTAAAAGQATITATTQGRSGTLAMSVVLSVTTTFEGSVAGGAGQSGAFRVSIQSPVSAAAVHTLAVVGASGSLTLINGGGTSILTGTFDTVTNTLSLSGGGFALTGTVGQGAFTGTYTGPASTNGAFAGLNSTGTTVTVMCGTYSGTDTGSGIWNLQVAASGAASGVTRPNLSSRDPQPRSQLMTGQLNGNILTLRSVDIRPDGSTFTATATGTVQGTSVTGTHDNGQGTFSGSAAACR